MPEWAMSLPLNLIRDECAKNGVDPYLVAAIASCESSGNVWATRYEAHYRWLYKPEKFAHACGTTIETEEHHQRTSWGLCQLMGAVAREHGHHTPMPSLCRADLNVRFACRHLLWLYNKYGIKQVETVLAAYNAGSPRDVAPKDGVVDNHKYVAKVMARYLELTQGAKP